MLKSPQRTIRTPALLCAAAMLPLAACAPAPDADAAVAGADVLYGPAVAVGGGTARSYVVLAANAPTEMGVALSEAALADLPTGKEPGGIVMPDGLVMYEHVLAMPEGNPTPYRHILLDWNPGGHEPPGVYDLPHFDFHFYTTTEAERRAIDPSDPEFQAKAERFPAAGYLPSGYITPRPVVAVPGMGVHWVDADAPELNGETFTQTFIYGTWDGQTTFVEPMITRAFLEGKPDFRAPVAAPERYPSAGYYPRAYRIYWDEGAREYRVSLADFEWRG